MTPEDQVEAIGLLSTRVGPTTVKTLLSLLDRAITEGPGDVVEFGCNLGTCSVHFARWMQWCGDGYRCPRCDDGVKGLRECGGTKCPTCDGDWEPGDKWFARTLYCYDSFEGMPKPGRYDQEAIDKFRIGEGSLGNSYEEWRANMRGINPHLAGRDDCHTNVFSWKGWFKDIPHDALPLSIRFAFFDGDLYQSIVDSWVKCWNRLEDGAIVAVHDVHSLPGVRRACAEFFNSERPNENIQWWIDGNVGIYKHRKKG